jgi:hypothetical protein
MADQYEDATQQLEQNDATGAGQILEGASGLPQKPQQPAPQPPQANTGAKLKKVVDGKVYPNNLAGEMEWLDAIRSRLMRTDMKSPYEVTILEKALMPWLQEYGDGHQVVPDGVPNDRLMKAIRLFQGKVPHQMKMRQKAANKNKNIEDYIFDKVKGDEKELFNS